MTASGANYVALPGTPLAELGSFDLVVEAAGDAQLMADALGLLRRSGVACLLGIDPADATRRAGRSHARPSTRSSRTAFCSAASTRPGRTGSPPSPTSTALASAGRTSSSSSSDLRVPLDRFDDAFAHRGGKATLVLSD